MKRASLLLAALLLSAGMSVAQTTQAWTSGWDIFNEPLNFTRSSITWSVSATSKLTVTFRLVGARPSKVYQVGVTFFCTTFPATFGQFPTGYTSSGNCMEFTKQGVTETLAAVELGVVTTDIHGNGSFSVVVGPIAAGTYDVEFKAENGAGCNLTGGGNGNGGTGPVCDVDFQSPGTFGNATTITVP
jgi:hypothetical protein